MSRLTFGVFLLCFALTGTASGFTGEQAGTDIESHCVVRVLGQGWNGELWLSAPVCFDTLASAFEAAASPGLAFGARPERTAGTDSYELLSFTLGTHFDGLNGTGSSISVVGSSCGGGWWNTGATWANRISSSWNGCYRLRHHDGPGASGASADTVGAGSTHNLPGAMNNKTESVSYWGS